ncbi:50S ribosomal protein L1 [bacterium]|nr:50S ribosomal protein L1 [bacterium]
MTSRRTRENRVAVAAETPRSVAEAVVAVQGTKAAGFDESVDLHIHLNIDPRQADEQVRGTMSLPHGTGAQTRVAVFAEGDAAREAGEAGAAVVGGKELVAEVKAGRLDFDIVLAHPEMMRLVAPLGRVLGPRGLMPSPKAGTVAADLATAVTEFLKGKQAYRNDAGGNVHLRVGKRSFSESQLVENVSAALDAIKGIRPSAVKGVFMKRATLSATMGPGVEVAV